MPPTLFRAVTTHFLKTHRKRRPAVFAYFGARIVVLPDTTIFEKIGWRHTPLAAAFYRVRYRAKIPYKSFFRGFVTFFAFFGSFRISPNVSRVISLG
jgi:hypothetical protein